MHLNMETARNKHNRHIKRFEHLSKMVQMSKAMQTRFALIPGWRLNDVVVAGIRDMNLVFFKDGQLVGGNILRFNNPIPNSKSDYYRIVIDPMGIPNSANLHIPVSQGFVKTANVVQKGMKIAGSALLVMSIVASGVRIGKAIYDEVKIDSEIQAMECIIDCLKEDLQDCANSDRAEKEEALDFARSLLEDARICKLHTGKKSVLTSLCVGGEWCGAAVLSYAGAQGGAAIGAVGGPMGAIVGAVAGSVIGAVTGSELGASAVENFRRDKDGIATEMQGSLVGFGNKVQGEVLGVDGNVFLGKGVEVGARATLFQMVEKDERSIAVGKLGANFGITNKGVDVSVEGKLVWAETETKKTKVGVGWNVDTGFQKNEHGVQVSVLGFGFSAKDDSVCIKLPFFNFTLVDCSSVLPIVPTSPKCVPLMQSQL